MHRFKPKNCIKCNAEFQPRSSTDVWCVECKKKKCQYCNTEFVVKSPNKFETHHFCSKDCQIKGRKSVFKIKCERCQTYFVSNSASSKLCIQCKTYECQNCGKNFIIDKLRDEKTIKYCSQKCLIERRDTRVQHVCKNCGKVFISSSGSSTLCKNCCTVTCLTCGNYYEVQPKRLKTSKYCSKDCRIKGDMNHIWQEEDFNFIKEHYPYKMSLKEIADKFNTSISAIARLKHKLNLDDCPIELRQRRVGDSQMLWTEEKITNDIRNLNKSEVPLNSSYIQKNFQSLHTAAFTRFGSWKNAINSAGYDYDEINLYSNRVTWTPELIKQEILRLNKKDTDLKASSIRDTYASLFNAARRESLIGTWEKAIEFAGLQYSEIAGSSWGETSIGIDGNIYPSIIECSVSNEIFELLDQRLIADYFIQVPLTKERRWTCDFVVTLNNDETIWIEVDGLGDSRREGSYGEEHEKIAYYLNNNFEFYIVNKTGQAAEIIKKRTHSIL